MADTFDDFPIVRDLGTIQDADWSKTFTYKLDGSPVNLTGYAAEFVVFDEFENLKASATSAGGGVVLGGSAGTITPSLSSAITDALPASSYRYVLWLINGSGKRLPFAMGRFNITKAVSA